MPIKYLQNNRTFDYLANHNLTGTVSVFTVINPYFFDYLKKTSSPEETVELAGGIKIIWLEESRRPIVILDDFGINEQAQLFYQMYGNQLVETAL